MVIFHSYVSLPEGMGMRLQIWYILERKDRVPRCAIGRHWSPLVAIGRGDIILRNILAL